MLKFNPLKSWTFWGAIGSALVWLAQQAPVDPMEVAQALGGIVTVLGARNAIQKSGPVQ